MSRPVFGYWKIRGLGQPARLMLAFAGVDFEDRTYECGPGPAFDRKCWTSVKNTLGLDFPNLPYYIDGDVKVSHSNAVMRHIARKHQLDGNNEAERLRLDLILEESQEFRNGWVRLCYSPTFEKMKPSYLLGLPDKVATLEKYLGDREWFAGRTLTFVDFMLYELLDQHRHLVTDMLCNCPKLQAFMTRFEELPKIKAYMASPKFLKAPINNKMAKWGTSETLEGEGTAEIRKEVKAREATKAVKKEMAKGEDVEAKIHELTNKLLEAEKRAEEAERTSARLQKEVDKLEAEMIKQKEVMRDMSDDLDTTFADLAASYN